MDNTFSTGIPALDDALGSHLAPGNLIICAGLTGGGKTILAGQLGAKIAMAGHKVLFISTEVPEAELDVRILSAFCNIPYDEIMDGVREVTYGKVFGNLAAFPSPDRFGIDAYAKAVRIREPLVRNFHFKKITTLGFAPGQALGTLISEYEGRVETPPEVLVFDHLQLLVGSEHDIFKLRKAAGAATEAMASLARERGILAFVFCQADPALTDKKKITSDNIFEFQAIWKSADAFIGISHRHADGDSSEIWERIQHLTVKTNTTPDSVLVPVETAFKYQRFEPYRGQRRGSEPGSDELRRHAREIEARSENGGYVLARRNRLGEIFHCGLPYAVNFYAFLLVAAKTQGREAGSSFYSRAKLTEMLGLTSKQLILSMDILLDRDLIDVPPKRRGRSLD